MPTAREYRVEVIKEGGLGTVFLGASKLPLRRIEDRLNTWAREGWALNFMLVEKHRFLLFWTREAVIVTLVRALNVAQR